CCRPPRNPCSNVPFDKLPGWLPTASDRSAHCGHRGRRRPPVGSRGRVRPTRERLLTRRRTNDHSSSNSSEVDSGSSGSGLSSVSLRGGSVTPLFVARPDPYIARHAESAGQVAQRTALFIGAQNLLALLRGVAIGLGI